MATKLNKDVFRETYASVRDRSKSRNLIAGLCAGDVITIRLKGTRRVESLPIDHVYYHAVKVRVAAERAQKAAARKAKREGR